MQELNSCNRYHRCRQYRTCDDCARLRQAHIADVAEELLSQYQALYVARITPYSNTSAEITRLKAAVKRQLENNDALWSVEQGTEKGLLHLNIISPVAFFKKFKMAEYWQGEQVRNLRQAAAYMLKKSQIPEQAAYSGRQFGAFKSMSDLFAAKEQLPIIQAAHAEKITLAGWSLPSTYVERQDEIERMRKSERGYSEIANDHLQKLRLFTAQNKGTDK